MAAEKVLIQTAPLVEVSNSGVSSSFKCVFVNQDLQDPCSMLSVLGRGLGPAVAGVFSCVTLGWVCGIPWRSRCLGTDAN